MWKKIRHILGVIITLLAFAVALALFLFAQTKEEEKIPVYTPKIIVEDLPEELRAKAALPPLVDEEGNILSHPDNFFRQQPLKTERYVH